MTPRFLIVSLLAGGLLSSCGSHTDSAQPEIRKSFSERMQDIMDSSVADVPSGLMDGTRTQKATQLTASTQEEMLSKFDSKAVFFTDPYDTESPIPGLEEAFAKKIENRKWIQSYATALRDAQAADRPILIWFHHSKGSPPSQKLAEELLYTEEFEDWAKENLIRVCYDQAEEFESESNGLKRKEMQTYVKKAPSLFGVRGTPVLLIMSPDGSRVDHIRGYYSGQSRLLFDQIKNSVKVAMTRYDEFKKTLIPKGYRTWTGKNGNKLFAKLTRYTEKNKTLWLQTFDGHLTKTTLKNLSEEDQRWITDAKAEHDQSQKRSSGH